ncbi:hypothetical protein ACOSP7_013105 [Xanthoceras sorbifolium]
MFLKLTQLYTRFLRDRFQQKGDVLKMARVLIVNHMLFGLTVTLCQKGKVNNEIQLLRISVSTIVLGDGGHSIIEGTLRGESQGYSS